MNRPYTTLLAITAVSTLVVAALVLIVPDHTGELRTDLEVGDYYVLHTAVGNVDIKYQIEEIRDDGTLYVEIQMTGKGTTHVEATPEQYLSQIYFENKSDVNKMNKRAIIETEYGERICSLYKTEMSEYWVDSHNIIFKSFIGGVYKELTDCTLVIQ